MKPMAKRLSGWLVLVPFCAILVLFALANRQLVVVNLNPFVAPETLARPGYGVPFFVTLFCALLVGVLLGGAAAWLAQGKVRAEKRHWRRETQYLSRELETLRRSAALEGRCASAETEDLLLR